MMTRFLPAFVLCANAALLTVHAQTLTHGPFAGAVTSTSVRFYVRIAPAAAAGIRLSLSPNFDNAIVTTAVRTDSTHDFTALLAISNLQPDQRYYYQALVNDQPTGETRSFRTFYREGERAPFQFAFGSCVVVRRQPQPGDGRVFNVMQNDDLSFFLQIGDWTYSDTTDSPTNPQRVFSAELSRVQATYRAKYDSAHALQHVLRTTPIDYVYDDHDYMNDDASALSYPRPDSMRTIGVSPLVREYSIRGYQELFPGYPLANAQGGIWHKFTCGNADFFMLDTRSQRRPNLDAFVYNPTTDSVEFTPDEKHSMLAGYADLPGENQMDWLLRELRASTADWKFVVTTVPFNRGLAAVIERSVMLQDSIVTVPGYGTNSLLRIGLGMADKWVGFPADQERLLNYLDEHQIKNVIMLSGDTHTAAIDDGQNGGLPELMAGALEQSNSRLVLLLELFGINIWNGGGQNLASGNFNDAYGRVTVFGADSVLLEIVDEFGARVAGKVIRAASGTAVISNAKTPGNFQLLQSFPNPFSPAQQPGTILRYELLQPSYVDLVIYDLTGRRVRNVPAVWQQIGLQQFRWDGRDAAGEFAASGVYLMRINLTDVQGRQQSATRKIVLLR